MTLSQSIAEHDGMCACHPSYTGNIIGGFQSRLAQAKKGDSILKITKSRMGFLGLWLNR
jgi:hypothetical protein